MKQVLKKVAIFIITIILLSCNKVYANSYALSFTTTADKTLKAGDIIELKAGIACVADNASYQIFHQKFLLLYDKNIFDLVDKDNPYILRDGWKYRSQGFREGELEAEIEASNYDNSITAAIASDNCRDSINAVLLTYKLKVKNVANQDTKIQVVNNINYVEELNFSVYNQTSNNNLSMLKVDNYELDSAFNKNKTDYEVYVPYTVEKVNIVATVEDSKASVYGAGEKQLAVGDNKTSIVVTAENGSKKTYTINIIRKDANDDTTLSKVLVTDSNKDKISVAYDEKTKTYTGNVSSEITFVSFDIKCSGEDCFVDELSSESVKEGKNEFKFSVVSQNGDKEEYKIIINKEAATKDNSILYLSIGLGISTLLCVVLLILYLKSRNK